jgi:hypothetical protein
LPGRQCAAPEAKHRLKVIVHSLVECTNSAVVVSGTRERDELVSEAVPCANFATVFPEICKIRVACPYNGVITFETLFRQRCVFFTAEIRDPGLERIFAKRERRCGCAVPGRRPDCASDFRLYVSVWMIAIPLKLSIDRARRRSVRLSSCWLRLR